MKKITTLLCAVALMMVAAPFQSFADDPDTSSKDEIVVKKYNLSGFHALKISSVFDVKMKKSDTYSLRIELKKNYEKYLKVKVEGGYLKVDLDGLPPKFSNYDKVKAKIEVSMPDLNALYLSGSTKFSCDDKIELGMGEFKLNVSGSGRVDKLIIQAADAEMNISGTSSVYVTAFFGDVDVNVSGASKLNGSIDASEAEFDVSGASKVDVRGGDFSKMEIDASGASSMTVTGTADRLNVDCSGASTLRATDLKADKVDVETSGAAEAKVWVVSHLNVECSGTSTCIYKADDDVSIKFDVARMSTLRKMK